MSDSTQKLRLGALIALVVGSMVGGGIFSLPQNIAASASAGATLIGWLITGVGMLTLAFVFQTLANRKPDLNGGVYAYAKAGFGDYMGFSSAWGYWISAWIGNVSYMVLLFSTLGYFFPVFGEGNTLPAIICASIVLWLLHFLVLRGIREAAFINTITTIAKAPFLVVTSAKSGINSMDDLLKQIKADKVNFGSAGPGSPQHMLVEMFQMQTKLKSPHIPYKGSGPLILAVMGNEVQYAIDNPVPLKPQIDAGKIKALAITSKHASPKFPGVKSLHEQGFTNFEVEPWYGMIGSKGMPKELAERMNGYVQDILKQDSVKQKISDLGAEAYGMSTGDFAKLIDADIKKWGEAVKASGATAD